MGYTIRIAIPEDEQRIRELFIEMLQTRELSRCATACQGCDAAFFF